MINKLNFLNDVFKDFKPSYSSIQSIKLYSETISNIYCAVYITMSPVDDSLMLSLVMKSDKANKEKEVVSFPAYIENDYIYLSDNSDFDYTDEYKLIKKMEDFLYISPRILELISKGYFHYIPKSALVPGGEPSVTEASIKKALSISEDIELTEENFLDGSISLDYKLKFSIKNNHFLKKKSMQVLSMWNLCAFGTGMPNCNIRHSPVHPFTFKEDESGNKIVRGEFYTTPKNKFFRVREDGPHIMVQYKDNVINETEALLITFNSYPNPDKSLPNIVVNYVVKPVDVYEGENKGEA